MNNLTRLENEIQDFTRYFVIRYFGKECEWYWIGDDIGGVLSVADYFFNLTDMVDFVRYKYTRKQMFDYYDYALKERMDGKEFVINIKNWKK